MSLDENQTELLPFEQAEENIKKFAQNASLLQSIVMLVGAADQMKGIEGQERIALEEIFEDTLIDLSGFIELLGAEWN